MKPQMRQIWGLALLLELGMGAAWAQAAGIHRLAATDWAAGFRITGAMRAGSRMNAPLGACPSPLWKINRNESFSVPNRKVAADPSFSFNRAETPAEPPRHRLFPSVRWGGLSLAAGAGLGWVAAGKAATTSQRWHSAAVYGLIAGAWTETSLALLRPHARVRWTLTDDWLAGGIVTVQTLDDLGTLDFRRAGYNEWLLSNAEVDRQPQLVLTEAAVAGAGIGVMYLLDRAGHRKWAHWLAGLYIAAGAASYYNNEHYARTGKSWF